MKRYVIACMSLLALPVAAQTMMVYDSGGYGLWCQKTGQMTYFHLHPGYHFAIVPDAEPPSGWDKTQPWPPAGVSSFAIMTPGNLESWKQLSKAKRRKLIKDQRAK